MKLGDHIERLRRKASQSICHFKIAAIGISKHGEPLGCVFNHPRFSRKGGGVHAEMALMMKAPRNLHTIIICRVNNNGTFRPIHPCAGCLAKARELGIKIVPLSEIEIFKSEINRI